MGLYFELNDRNTILKGNGACAKTSLFTLLPPSPVIYWIELGPGGKPKWLPSDVGYHDEMCTSPIAYEQEMPLFYT